MSLALGCPGWAARCPGVLSGAGRGNHRTRVPAQAICSASAACGARRYRRIVRSPSPNGKLESVIVSGQYSGLRSIGTACTGRNRNLQYPSCCQGGHRECKGEGSRAEGRDEVMANSGSGSAANADLDSAGQADAAARGRELITWLTRRRAASGLSQAAVARLMQTSQSAVARLESGQHDVQLSTLTRYAGALGLSLDFVEGAGTGTRPRAPAPVPGPKLLRLSPRDRTSPIQIMSSPCGSGKSCKSSGTPCSSAAIRRRCGRSPMPSG